MGIDVGRANRALMDGLTLSQAGAFENDRLRIERISQRVGVYISLDEGETFIHQNYADKTRLKVYLKLESGETLVLDAMNTDLNHAEAILVFREGAWVDYQANLSVETAKIELEAATPAEFKPIDDKDLFKE